MKHTVLEFESPYQVRVSERQLPALGSEEVLVESQISAISSGTEMLAYKGLLPDNLALDENLAGMQGLVSYPLSYGYAVAGKVIETGRNVDAKWEEANVFAFKSHQSHYVAHTNELVQIPSSVQFEDAVCLANMETAVSFLMDGKPLIGEKILVIGLGVVGMLTTSLLLRNADLSVSVVDLLAYRRTMCSDLGNVEVLEPTQLPGQHAEEGEKFDLVYELSGSPAGLNTAIEVVRETGRIVVGSWYGKKPASINLGSRFHRAKINIYGSQVSRLDPVHTGRWTKKRRMDLAVSLLKPVKPSQFISHTFPIQHAEKAYALLDGEKEEVLQVVFKYN